MNPIDTAALRAVALAATKGEWSWWTSNSFRRLTAAGGRDGGVLDAAAMGVAVSQADAAHIVAAQPAIILALLDELDAMRATAKPAKGKQEYPAAFESTWQAYPPRAGGNKKATFRAWTARIKAGVAPADMLAGAARYAAFVLAERTEERYIKQPATFFGPDEHYALPWRPTRGAPVRQDANDEAKRRLFGGDDEAFNAAG